MRTHCGCHCGGRCKKNKCCALIALSQSMHVGCHFRFHWIVPGNWTKPDRSSAYIGESEINFEMKVIGWLCWCAVHVICLHPLCHAIWVWHAKFISSFRITFCQLRMHWERPPFTAIISTACSPRYWFNCNGMSVQCSLDSSCLCARVAMVTVHVSPVHVARPRLTHDIEMCHIC